MLAPIHQHFACLPISISVNDPFYSAFKQRCMNFVRAALNQQHNSFSYGKQFSRVTHYLDGSFIYGSDSQTVSDLRQFVSGQLKIFDNMGQMLLPLATDSSGNCLPASMGGSNTCFKAGDGRVNQIISLTTLHILFLREHNRIAFILSQLNPHWNDEIIFRETQRIVVAEYQVIIYKEWLPLIIGQDAMNHFELNLHDHVYSQDYRPDLNVAVTNEFAAAAFRFGHSTVDGNFL